MRNVLLIVGLLAAVAIAGIAGGCTSEQIDGLKKAVGVATTATAAAEKQTALLDASVKAFQEDREDLAKKIATMPAGPDRDAAGKSLAAMDTIIVEYQGARDVVMNRLTKLKAVLAAAEANLAEAEDAGDVVLAVAKALAPLGGPWGALAISVVGLGVSVWRQVVKGQEAAAGRKVIQAVEAAKVDGVVDFNSEAARDKLKALMGPDGEALVNEVQGKSAKTAA